MILNKCWARLSVMWLVFTVAAAAQTVSDYDSLVQKGKTQLQAGSADMALASGEAAIRMNASRWEAYALAGGALMNMKRYEEAADKLSEAIKQAPEPKQIVLRDLRRQCLLADTPAQKKESTQSSTTKAEIVLWKSIENSTKAEDFQLYLNQYPQGAFAVLARGHLADAERERERQAALYGTELPNSIWIGESLSKSGKSSDNFTIVVAFLDGGRVVWRGFADDKEDRPKLAQIRSDLGAISKEAFLKAHLSELKNAGSFTLENGTVLKANFASKGDVHCQFNFDGHLDHNAISGAGLFVGDSTHEAGKCQKWPQFDWRLQRTFQ